MRGWSTLSSPQIRTRNMFGVTRVTKGHIHSSAPHDAYTMNASAALCMFIHHGFASVVTLRQIFLGVIVDVAPGFNTKLCNTRLLQTPHTRAINTDRAHEAKQIQETHSALSKFENSCHSNMTKRSMYTHVRIHIPYIIYI